MSMLALPPPYAASRSVTETVSVSTDPSGLSTPERDASKPGCAPGVMRFGAFPWQQNAFRSSSWPFCRSPGAVTVSGKPPV